MTAPKSITYRECFTGMPPDVQDEVLPRFRLAGGNRSRWNANDIALMAMAITITEDALEMMSQTSARIATRKSLRTLRRRLEACESQDVLTGVWVSMSGTTTCRVTP